MGEMQNQEYCRSCGFMSSAIGEGEFRWLPLSLSLPRKLSFANPRGTPGVVPVQQLEHRCIDVLVCPICGNLKMQGINYTRSIHDLPASPEPENPSPMP